jgi:tRNA/tmRNA/rRNA uracil-C5-methylase (TrmA/RlmC/RlmD family)
LTNLTLTVGPAANGGSCIARHDGRVVFVRYALPGEQVVARVTQEKGSHWHAEVVEVIDPSPDRVDSLCPIAGVDGAGCCDLAFVKPDAALRIKGDVVGNQLGRLGGFEWVGEAEEVGSVGATGWRRVAIPAVHLAVCALAAVRPSRDPGVAPHRVLAAFLIYHWSYGAGFFSGLSRVVLGRPFDTRPAGHRGRGQG